MSGEAQTLPLDAIIADDRCQPRATFDNNLVEQYAEAMANGDQFPPVAVFYDGIDYFLGDGFHRYHSAKSLGLTELAAIVRPGTLRDAILHSCSANAAHGWRRTNDDKRRAVMRLLNDTEWSTWSDREIARHCLVDHKTVGTMRPAPPAYTGELPQYESRTFIHPKTGQPTQMRTGNIGAAPKPRTDDRPVFDNTETGSRWQDTAAPERSAQIDNVNRETGLANLVWEIVKMQKQLPPAGDASDRFPALLLHSLNVSEIRTAAKWLAVFADDIERRKDQINVAAE